MKLFEYQAKEVFQNAGIPVPNGVVVSKAAGTSGGTPGGETPGGTQAGTPDITPGGFLDNISLTIEEIKRVAAGIGYPCMLKAQVLSGGRGKAGLIHYISSPEELTAKTKQLFDGRFNVAKVLVEQAVDFTREIYLSVTIDPMSAQAMIMACAEGGVDIETLAETAPEKIIRETVDKKMGVMDFQTREIAYKLNITGPEMKQFCQVVKAIYQLFVSYDAELAEINPLFITSEGQVVAGDGKLILDDNAKFRQTGYEQTKEYFDSDIEYEAHKEGIPYLQFDGNISLMCAGAGLTNTVYDLIHDEGGTVANYLEFGGPNYTKAKKAMELCLKNKSSVILIVTFGTIARADVMAQGVVDAIRELKPDRPVVVCIRGTNEDEAVRILGDAGIACIMDTEEAVVQAVRISEGRKQV